MPKETQDTHIAARTPYTRGSPCVPDQVPRTCYPKKEDGTLDMESGFVSNKWVDGTLRCTDGDGEKADLWLKTDEALKEIKAIRDKKVVKYLLFC